MKNRISYNRVNAVLLFIVMSLSAASFYFEYVEELNPCPLCIMQRVCVLLLIPLTLAALCFKSQIKRRLISSTQLFVTLAGMGFAGRQVYLQSLPPEKVPACGPGLNYLIQYFPLKDIVHAILFGSGDCAEVQWVFLNLTMPTWSLLSFALIACLLALTYLSKTPT